MPKSPFQSPLKWDIFFIAMDNFGDSGSQVFSFIIVHHSLVFSSYPNIKIGTANRKVNKVIC